MKTLKGINLCHCGSGASVIKEFCLIKKETKKYYIVEDVFGDIKVNKDQETWKLQRDEYRELYTKSAKLTDDDGTILEIMKDYYKFFWAELVYEKVSA